MLEKFHIPDRSMLVDIQYVRENRKDKIPDTLYDAMINYKVEITD